MRGRVRDYSIRVVGNKVKVYCLRPSDLPPQVAEWSKQIAESIRLVVDETAKIVFCSSMQKDKLSVEASDITGYSFALVFDIPSDKVVRESDQFTIELDWGEMLVTAKETTLNERADEILNAIGGSCKIDTTELAKQGDDQEATNTAIHNAVNALLSRSVKYDKQTGNLTIENVELIIE